MKQLKLETLKKWMVFILPFIILGVTSCNQAQEKATSNATIKAPSSTIHAATFMGNAKDVNQHIAANTDLNEKDAYGSTPLHIAATFDKTDIAILLIEGGANVNKTDANGSTPLHTAAFFGRIDIVKALLENNADISIRNSYNSTALESVSSSFDDVKPIYDQLSKDLGPFGLKLDYSKLKVDRTVITELINARIN